MAEAPPTAVVEFITFDQIEDTVTDIEDFFNQTLALSDSPPELWTEQF